MSDAVVIESTLIEASAKTKAVREQLRTLEAALNALAIDVSPQSAMAAGRLDHARVNVASAIAAIPCTDTTQMPF